MNTITEKIGEVWHQDIQDFEGSTIEPTKPKWFDGAFSDFQKIQAMKTDIVQTEVYYDFMGYAKPNSPAMVAREMLHQLSRGKISKARGTKKWMVRVEEEFIFQWIQWKNEFQTNVLKGVEPRV